MLKSCIYPSHLKGYRFECVLYNSLVNNGFSGFESNNLGNIHAWYKSVRKGPDLVFQVNGRRIEVEAKCLEKRCYCSWVLRDYVTRFSFAANTVPIVVCSNKLKITHRGREELRKRHIRLMDRFQLITYMLKVHRRRDNKHICYNTSYGPVDMVSGLVFLLFIGFIKQFSGSFRRFCMLFFTNCVRRPWTTYPLLFHVKQAQELAEGSFKTGKNSRMLMEKRGDLGYHWRKRLHGITVIRSAILGMALVH